MAKIITQEYIEENLLSNTKLLFNHIHWIEENFDNVLPSNKKHKKTAINYNDIKERREDFIKELTQTITRWVYGQKQINEIISDRMNESNDTADAYTFLANQAQSKFRPNAPQGQFGELLLFNFIQYFFKAAPLLRKQPLTSSVGMERYGADAIHYKKEGEHNLFILGESKCYKSKYKFPEAFSMSVKSIVSSFKKIDSELDLYVYDNFIDENLSQIAKDYKNGKLKDVKYELVCLVAYNENGKLKGEDEDSIKAEILEFVKGQCKKIKNDSYEGVEVNILSKIHYIFFPIFELDELLKTFSNVVGSNHAK